MNVDITEQWRLNGDCEKCRKQKYCSKPCTANKTNVKGMIDRVIREATGLDATFKALEK